MAYVNYFLDTCERMTYNDSRNRMCCAYFNLCNLLLLGDWITAFCSGKQVSCFRKAAIPELFWNPTEATPASRWKW